MANHEFSPDLVIYQDELAVGWQDWSWGSAVVLDDPAIVHNGTSAIATTFQEPWGALSLRPPVPITPDAGASIDFWIFGGEGGTQLRLQTQATDADGLSLPFDFTAEAGVWSHFSVPLSQLGDPAVVARLSFQDGSGLPQATFYIDDLRLLGVFPVEPQGVALQIDVLADRQPISEYIYGIHYAEDVAFAAEIDLPILCWGGNDTTRYNWKNNMYGNPDWYFENELRTESADQWIAKNKLNKVDSIITIPMIGYVAKDAGQVGNSGSYQCSFDTRKYAYQPQPAPYSPNPGTDPDDPNRAHCGTGIVGYENGNQEKPIYFVGNDPLDTSIVIDQQWATEWVEHLKAQHGARGGAGGVRFYSLDNEPDIWFQTHRDVAPDGLTMQKLRTDSYNYAAAIKAADPTALVIGLVVHGWTYYWHSPADGKIKAWDDRPDRKANGDRPLVAWYLAQMAAYEQQHGVRLLDYLDLHYYTAAVNKRNADDPNDDQYISQQDAGDPETQALRLRSTRSLWDPTYSDESWIATAPVSDENGQIADFDKVRLIPRMREWVAANYPGSKLAITEYNWGALDHINGALTQADVLGIFGREGLDMALLFDSNFSPGGKFTPDGPGAYAFRIYLNYDGNGSKFGDTRIQASSSDQERLAIYAAQRSNDGSLTMVIINKTESELIATLTIANYQPSALAEVYRYSAANLAAIVRQADQAVTPNAFSATYPANSISLIRLAQMVE